MPRLAASPYAAFYCEENTWQRLADDALANSNAYALWISNPTRTVAIFEQKLAASENDCVVWDYHVVTLFNDGQAGSSRTWWIYDADSRLGPLVGANRYVERSFPRQLLAATKFAPHFRAVPRETFLSQFDSARDHMRDAAGMFRAAPPPWPCLRASVARALSPADLWSFPGAIQTPGTCFDLGDWPHILQHLGEG